MTDFDVMRADLVDRGLLDREFRLTAAGNAHVAATMEELRATTVTNHDGPRVVWRTDRKRSIAA